MQPRVRRANPDPGLLPQLRGVLQAVIHSTGPQGTQVTGGKGTDWWAQGHWAMPLGSGFPPRFYQPALGCVMLSSRRCLGGTARVSARAAAIKSRRSDRDRG